MLQLAVKRFKPGLTGVYWSKGWWRWWWQL